MKTYLKDREVPLINGLTAYQRFFLAWSQSWRENGIETKDATDNINIYGTEEYFEKNTDKNRWKNISDNVSKENKENQFKELSKEESIRFINKMINTLKENYQNIIKNKENYAHRMLKTYIDNLKNRSFFEMLSIKLFIYCVFRCRLLL